MSPESSSPPTPPISGDQQQAPPPSPTKSPKETAATDVRNGTNENNGKAKEKEKEKEKDATTSVVQNGRVRPTRACTVRTAARLQAAAQQAALEKQRPKAPRKERKQRQKKEEEEEEDDDDVDDDMLISEQCGNSKIITPLVGPPEPSQLPRWGLRSMWELASILNFLHVFRPLLNIIVEFSAEELETALLTPNDTLADIHMPLLKAIPPITRMALTRDSWVTVLCRKLRDWWHWVAEGELPIIASHGAEIEMYKSLDPGVRVVILKALCDIRVEQEDIRNYIDNSMKHGAQLSAFRKDRIGGDSHGVHYWYEDDPMVGHRLYREIRKVEVKNPKAKGSRVIPIASYRWEAVATNLDEFQDVSDKLVESKNRTEASVGKKLKIDMLPEIEKVHKKKERLLKKQHREALLLDNFLSIDGLAAGRSLRDRKPVTYTFDDYDRSINEAIKITKKRESSPEPTHRRVGFVKPEASTNGKWSEPLHGQEVREEIGFSAPSPGSSDFMDIDEEQGSEPLDRSNRRRKRPQRYSERDYVEAISDHDFDSDDDIVGEAVYDEEYLRKRKQRKVSSSSEGDEEYRWDEENAEEEEEEEDEEEESFGASDDSGGRQKFKKLRGRTRRETKLRSVRDLQPGLRRSKRSTRNRINYRQYEFSESDTESVKPEKWDQSNEHSEASENEEYSAESPESENTEDEQEIKSEPPVESFPEEEERDQNQPAEKPESPGQEDVEGEQPESSGQEETDGERKTRFLDLNELAPGSNFDDGPTT